MTARDSAWDGETCSFLVSDIKTGPDASLSDVYMMAKKKLKAVGAEPSEARYSVFKKSVDARRKSAVSLVWTVCVTGRTTASAAEKLKRCGIRALEVPALSFAFGHERMEARPLIVGTGPAGLFAGLLLARNGYRPRMIERGGSVEERVEAVSAFLRERRLDPETNIQFGAGGAGTFSDGKLLTRINDAYVHFILETFVSFGAPRDILTQAKPHIGTDILRTVVQKILAQIEALGGSVEYHTTLLDISPGAHGGSALTGAGEIPYGAMILATGHSARDTYRMLMARSFTVLPKPFSVGVRVEHLQEDIDRAVYGSFAGHPALGHAEYALSTNTDKRGTYTFCMCPGGVVIAAASQAGTVVVNGMSYHARDGRNANSAVAVSVRTEDYGATPEGAIRFQQQIEEAAFAAAGADYAVPLVTMGDFLSGKAEKEPSRILPTYMDGRAYGICAPDAYLPPFVCSGLREAFGAFEQSIRGFSVSDALLCGPETRTSSPVRVLRGEDYTAPGFDAVYPCGEGAGYAGGITSAAADGIRCAVALMSRFAPLD